MNTGLNFINIFFSKKSFPILPAPNILRPWDFNPSYSSPAGSYHHGLPFYGVFLEKFHRIITRFINKIKLIIGYY